MANNGVSQHFKVDKGLDLTSDSQFATLSANEKIVYKPSGEKYIKNPNYSNVFDKTISIDVGDLEDKVNTKTVAKITDTDSNGIVSYYNIENTKLGSFKCKVPATVVNNAPALSWGQTSTIGTVDGTSLTVRMPDSPTITYGVATQTSNGLMSSSDKTKLDGITLDKYLTYTPQNSGYYYTVEYKTKGATIPSSDTSNGTKYPVSGWYIIGKDKNGAAQHSHELLSTAANDAGIQDFVNAQSGFVPKVGMIRQCFVNNDGASQPTTNDADRLVFRAGDTVSGKNLFLGNHYFQVDGDDVQWSFVQKMDGSESFNNAYSNGKLNDTSWSIDNTKYNSTWVALSPVRSSGDYSCSSGMFMCISVSTVGSGGSGGSSTPTDPIVPSKTLDTWSFSWAGYSTEENAKNGGYLAGNDGLFYPDPNGAVIGQTLTALRLLTNKNIESKADIISVGYSPVPTTSGAANYAYGKGAYYISSASYYYKD